MNCNQAEAVQVCDARSKGVCRKAASGPLRLPARLPQSFSDWISGAARWATAVALMLLVFAGHGGEAVPVDEALQVRLDKKLKLIQAWAQEPVLVDAVKAHNAGGGGSRTAMTREKWKTLSILDPLVRGLTRNAAASFLRERKTEVISEAFISGADGTKVAFLAKPSNWNHQGRPKHDLPMSGRSWQGPLEMDESTGLRQVQVAVPVLDRGVPIGSLVVGLSVTKLERIP